MLRESGASLPVMRATSTAGRSSRPHCCAQAGSQMQTMVPVSAYQDFSMFEAALASQLSGSNRALNLIATGHYAPPPNNTFTATRIGIALNN